MKKLPRVSRKNSAKTTTTPERITNDTVGEHRRRTLARARKFKYPIQYSRHKLVINTIIISVLALIAVGVLGWWQLYPQQNTSAFSYRVTSVVPLPVASVKGEYVRYSDYLLKFRSAEHYIQQKEQATGTAEDEAKQRAYLKTQSLRDAIADTYALKLAKSHNVSVSDEELQEFLTSRRQIDGSEISERTQYAVINDYYGWTPDEYTHIMRTKLLRQKVAYAIDDTARSTAHRVKELVDAAGAKKQWKDIISSNDADLGAVTQGFSGMVPKANQDGGLAAAAAQLKKGQTSELIRSSTEQGTFYALVRLVASNDTQINYEFILIPVKELQSQIDELYNGDEIRVFIDVPVEEATPHEQQ